MNFLSMEYFIMVADEGTFSRAAAKLFVSQQSLSEHVKKLEGELGTELFVRGRTLTLTQAGSVFYDGAKQILNARNQMVKKITSLTTARKSVVSIGIATYDTPPYLPELLTLYASKYPRNEAIVMKRQANDIVRSMNGIDLYFSWLPLESKLEHIIIKEDTFVAAVSQSFAASRYGNRWPSVERELLATQDLSVLKDLDFIYLYDRNGLRARDLDIILKSYNISPPVGFQSENADLNAEMCAHGAGVLIGPLEYISRKLKKYLNTEVSLYRIKTPGLYCAVAISHECGKILNEAEKQFIEVTKEYFGV